MNAYNKGVKEKTRGKEKFDKIKQIYKIKQGTSGDEK